MIAIPDRAEQLRIRAEIEELNAEFAYLIDHDRSEEVADLFTEGGSYGRASGERSTGREAIRCAYASRKAKGPRTARHIFTNLRLTYETATRVRATSILTLFAADGTPPHVAEPFLVADYDDICERGGDGRWRFASRTVTWLFLQRDGKVSPLPLGTPVNRTGG
ncbi:MAG: nuclear transport factor 2 family protein [Pseudomonadota bacterium]|nr:nuclear transport factor 2 family protein [Pseudomonadota bacterium]